MIIKKFIVIFVFLSIPVVAYCVDVVRLNVQIGATNNVVDIELFDSIVPDTVQNFMNYVDVTVANPRYDGSFIHRSMAGFVVQGGGYTFDQTFGAFEYDAVNALYTGGLQRVPQDAPIINEFPGSGLSNIRGTIGMAKASNNPDSATSEWFINLVDNSANLDTTNGGFTVFGKVIDDGMAVFELIESVPVLDQTAIHPAMESLPLDSYVAGDAIAQANLIRINTVRQIQRPILKTNVDLLDFGLLAVGDIALLAVTVQNVGNAELVMDANSIAAMVAPYAVSSENCSNATLIAGDAGSSCSITLKFEPGALGIFDAQMQIVPSVNPNNVTLSIDVTGEAVPVTPVSHIVDEPSVLDFGGTNINTTGSLDIIVQNRGGGTLSISSISISGTDSSLFGTDMGCSDTTNLLIEQTCTLTVNYDPVTETVANAILTINTNAGSFSVPLVGEGVQPEIEVPLSVDAGFTQINVEKFVYFTVKNIGAGVLEINDLTITGTDALDFTQTNNCPNVATANPQIISPFTGECFIGIYFQPSTVGKKNAILTIISNDSDETIIDITLTGTVGEPDIEAVANLEMGVSAVSGIPTFKQFKVFNRGSVPLQFNSFEFTGTNADSFSMSNNCPGISIDTTLASLEQDESCSIVIQMQAFEMGVISAQLKLASNDPDEGIVIINLTGTGDTDIDGIAASIEQAAPNSGDNNNDAVQDDVQSNVASFITSLNQYVTIITPPGTSIIDLILPPNPDNDASPGGIVFNHGLFQFKILASTVPPGATVKVAVFLPQGDNATSFYNYGVTPDNDTPHWYDFSFDVTTGTGVQYLGDVTIAPPQGGGATITRSMFLINYIDGARGDNDLTVDGVISNVSAVGTASDTGSGALSWLYFLSFITLLIMRNKRISA